MDLLSLVVAEATDAGPRIVSDTRVVFPEGPRSSFKTGTLKTVIITRDVTICFAGDVIAGLNGVRGFAKELRGGGRCRRPPPETAGIDVGRSESGRVHRRDRKEHFTADSDS